MATAGDIRKGVCIDYNGELFKVVDFQHVKPGKGGAFVRSKLKNLKTGKVVENTFNGDAKIDIQRVEHHQYQYLYEDDMGFNFMHNETFEQISIPEAMIEYPKLLKEGIQVEIVFHAETETPLTCELPPFVDLEITYTEPGFKGDTASSNALKPATLETGAAIQVPLFINIGDKIKVDTRDMSYYERVK